MVGTAQFRGDRAYQEDAFTVGSIDLPTKELRRALRDSGDQDAVAWRAGVPSGHKEPPTQQVVFSGLYDGHGGSEVSAYLKRELHNYLLKAQVAMVKPVVDRYREIGGFFRRFKGGSLSRLATDDSSEWARFGFSIEDKLALAFLQVICVYTSTAVHRLIYPSRQMRLSSTTRPSPSAFLSTYRLLASD